MEKRLVIPDRSSLDLLTPPHIPTRSSSKRDNLVRKLETLNQSVESLKTLVETGKRGQTELEWVREDIKLHETYAEIARDDIDGLLSEMSETHVLNTKEYKNYLRLVLKRHLNEADEAARLRAKRRRLEEDLSLVTPLNVEFPDDAGAFTNLLLELYVRGAPLKRDHEYQQALRELAIGRDIVCAHIYPYMLEHFASVSTYLFGLDVKDMVAYGYNVLLINSRFERAFDEGRVILLPDDGPVTNKPAGYVKNWKIVVLDCHDLQWEGLRLGDFDGKRMRFRNDARPTARFLYFHFVISLLRLRIDNHVRWRQFWKEYSNVTPFATRGRKYIRKSMLRSLAAYHGLVNEEKLDSFFGVEDAAFEDEIDVEKEVKSDIAHLVSKIKAKTSHGRNSITALIVDECPGCGQNHLDLFPDAFAELSDPSAGIIPVSWSIVECGITSPIILHRLNIASMRTAASPVFTELICVRWAGVFGDFLKEHRPVRAEFSGR
ncbi:hypothetical protein V8E54_002473 [Elaphomyces granulatus]